MAAAAAAVAAGKGGLDQEEFLFFPGWCGTTYLSSMPSALAIFTCRPNSHPFQERHVYLDEPVKIGRSVARCRPAQNNATFDCKVLSRNHALVWFDHKTGKEIIMCLYLKWITYMAAFNSADGILLKRMDDETLSVYSTYVLQ
ncbi:Sarcolemmal membrane-associated protein [Varanus komodoensis]|nr:Sarcolemmal membrane-associated protein [Varanus komodoensis]